MRIRIEDIVKDLRSGLRTKELLTKYGLGLEQFEQLLVRMIRDGAFSKEEYRRWKARKTSVAPADESGKDTVDVSDTVDDLDFSAGAPPSSSTTHIDTYVIDQPEKDHPWVLRLFSTKRENIKGAQLKIVLRGQKYSFTAEELIFRGPVEMVDLSGGERKNRREEALKYISKHGWAAYLEERAFNANFGRETKSQTKKARLVVLACKNNTYLAALHTPTPAVSFYVATTREKIRERLSAAIDISKLEI
ncbi:MAG: hypothetical protein V2B18_17125 [Pseudomonadota bacterium]